MHTSVALIVVNFLVWISVILTGNAASPVVAWLGLVVDGYCANASGYVVDIAAQQCIGQTLTWHPGFRTGAYWQALTSAFLHIDMLHFAFNMAALFILGPQLERLLGRVRFLAIYLLSALAGSALVLWLTPSYVTTLGASGAIFGMMGAVLVLAVKHRADLRPILVWLGANVAITLLGVGTISWQGHLGGLLGGLAVTAALIVLPRQARPTWQWPLVGVVAALILAGLAIPALT